MWFSRSACDCLTACLQICLWLPGKSSSQRDSQISKGAVSCYLLLCPRLMGKKHVGEQAAEP